MCIASSSQEQELFPIRESGRSFCLVVPLWWTPVFTQTLQIFLSFAQVIRDVSKVYDKRAPHWIRVSYVALSADAAELSLDRRQSPLALLVARTYLELV